MTLSWAKEYLVMAQFDSIKGCTLMFILPFLSPVF